MTKHLSVILCIALSFMCIFTALGYAALSDNLTTTGTAEIQIPSGLFIIGMTELSTSNADVKSYSYVPYSTTVDASISRRGGTAGSVTYEITVLNNTNLEYAYRGLYYQSNLPGYNNSSVSTRTGDNRFSVVTSFPNGTTVGPKEKLTFRVTYTVGRSLNSSTTYKTFLNYQFGINVESEAEAREAVYQKFLDILNTPSTYQTLYDAIDDKFDGAQEWTSNYIGNVSNAVDADSMTVETLFAGQLNMVINGQTQPASVLIKHENLDNNYNTGDSYTIKYNNQTSSTTYRGCEMTLYLTTEALDNAYGYADVYVTVFTCDTDDAGNPIGDWYRIGDTYLGQANVVGYKGETGGTGSFVTDNWVADAATYTPVPGYTYSVAQGITIKDLTRVVDSSSIAAFQSILDRAKAIIDDITYAGTAISLVENAYEAAAKYYTVDSSGNPVAISTTTRAQIIPIMIDLEYAVSKAEEEISQIQPQN